MKIRLLIADSSLYKAHNSILYCYSKFFFEKSYLLYAAVVVILHACTGVEQNKIDSYETRARELVSKMTLEEKVSLMTGATDSIGFPALAGIPRLGIPMFEIHHGPHGFKGWYGDPKEEKMVWGTYFPTSTAMGATWDSDLVYKIAEAMGAEMRSAGGHLNAGPAMNIIRDVRTGRSFEYFTEDPFLNGRTAIGYTKGLQSQKVIANLKHFIANNQEQNRGGLNVIVDERALREIYLPAFKAAIQEGGAWSLMSAYNRINGVYCNEEEWLLKEVLVDNWGFKGFVLSDWGGTHNTIGSIKAGMAIEMPREKIYGKKLIEEIKAGTITISELDELVVRILMPFIWTGALDEEIPIDTTVVNQPRHVAVAREAASKAMVLLKNENNMLPLNKKIKKLAVIGPNGEYGNHYRDGKYFYALLQGSGSSKVAISRDQMVTPFQGIKTQLDGQVEVDYAPGCYAETGFGAIPLKYISTPDGKSEGFRVSYFTNTKFEGQPIRTEFNSDRSYTWSSELDIPELFKQEESVRQFSVVLEGKLRVPETGEYNLEIRNTSGSAALYINDKLVTENLKGARYNIGSSGSVELKKGQEYDIKATYVKTSWKGDVSINWDYENAQYLKEALSLAAQSDAVILTVGNTGEIGETEGGDRDRITLYPAQERLINEIAKVNPNCTVVVIAGSAVAMGNWIDNVPSVLMGWFSGEQMGNALYDVLFGEVNPSGKLPITFPLSLDEYPKDHYTSSPEIAYNEGIYVGYRYFDHHNKEVQFPFGHGLSYTEFKYADIKANIKEDSNDLTVRVDLSITNTGTVEGEEVVQLYVRDLEASVDRPVKELKGFMKTRINPGETEHISIDLEASAFAYFDMNQKQWKVEAGDFELWAGSSSRDIRLKEIITIKSDRFLTFK